MSFPWRVAEYQMRRLHLIDRGGRIAAKYVGIVDRANIESNIKALLAEH